MSFWDGLSLDKDTANACGGSLKDTSTTLRKLLKLKEFEDDTVSTIVANGNGDSVISAVNDSRQIIADYLDVEKSNFNTVVTDLDNFDNKEGESYAEDLQE